MNGASLNVAASTVLSLCSGGGGLDLGLKRVVPDARTVCYVENEVTASGVLVTHMEDGGLDDAPLWTDLRSFDAKPWRGVVDWVIGGYPCQPFSNAGKRLGADDPRHLWSEVERIVRDAQPEWCFFENVGAHLRLGGREVLGSLHCMGYRTAAVLLTASEVGAPHGRERLFILAHREIDGRDEGRPAEGEDVWRDSSGSLELAYSENDYGWSGERRGEGGRTDVGHANFPRLEGRRITVDGGADEWLAWPPGPTDSDAWGRVLGSRPGLAPAVEPTLRGVADGLAGEAHVAYTMVQRIMQCDCRCHASRYSAKIGSTGLSGGHAMLAMRVDRVGSTPSRRSVEAVGGNDALRPVPHGSAQGDRHGHETCRSCNLPSVRAGLPAETFSALCGVLGIVPKCSWEDVRREAVGWQGDDEGLRKLRGGVRLQTASGEDLQQEMRERAGLDSSQDLARSDQLHILGNGVVPQQAGHALRMLMDALGE